MERTSKYAAFLAHLSGKLVGNKKFFKNILPNSL
jgi:hypothetical protein